MIHIYIYIAESRWVFRTFLFALSWFIVVQGHLLEFALSICFASAAECRALAEAAGDEDRNGRSGKPVVIAIYWNGWIVFQDRKALLRLRALAESFPGSFLMNYTRGKSIKPNPLQWGTNLLGRGVAWAFLHLRSRCWFGISNGHQWIRILTVKQFCWGPALRSLVIDLLFGRGNNPVVRSYHLSMMRRFRRLCWHVTRDTKPGTCCPALRNNLFYGMSWLSWIGCSTIVPRGTPNAQNLEVIVVQRRNDQQDESKDAYPAVTTKWSMVNSKGRTCPETFFPQHFLRKCVLKCWKRNNGRIDQTKWSRPYDWRNGLLEVQVFPYVQQVVGSSQDHPKIHPAGFDPLQPLVYVFSTCKMLT